MNRTNLKNYAPQARRDFIQAMKDRAAFFGLTAEKFEPVLERGDVAVIAGREHPRAIATKRKQLEARIKKHGFEQTMEAMAYTWFNRLVAIRFMELHGYLDHGYRVLSHPESKSTPEILEHAEHVDLPGLKKNAIIDLKLAGSKEGELYRLLLTAQCNALQAAMPFLFEKIDDETELLLPDNLLYSDSLIRKLVGEIEEEDWQQVEIIGWLYQFYISEKKDEVIGKVVASEDIPAATQLFTPNWIVKYLVQNTLGRQWLATYPSSALRQQMEYYIEPAEQTPEVQEQLKKITPTSLNPEELTLLDPACGSGHILVEAYDLFKAIYQERGYRAKDIPALVLQKNLFGLEIDDRAAQLAAFALMMKARADDRRIFDSGAKTNILTFENSQGMNSADITHALNAPINRDDVPSEYLFEEIQEDKDGLFSKKALAETGYVSQTDIASLLELFENATTFGSLIQVQPRLAAKLPEVEERLNDVLNHGNLTHALANVIKPLLQQARLLARQYDAVVANPPYMGRRFFSKELRAFTTSTYENGRADLYACFILRNLDLARPGGLVAMITMQNWMFLSSFEALRESSLSQHAIESFIHIGRGMWGSDFGTCSFAMRARGSAGYIGNYRRLFDKERSVATVEELAERFFSANTYCVAAGDFRLIPGSPLSYWSSPAVRNLFAKYPPLSELSPPRTGMSTGDNDRFLRLWHEVSYGTFAPDLGSAQEALASGKRWFPMNKGGAYCKWYGNNLSVVNWYNDGAEIKEWVVNNPNDPDTKSWSRRIFNHEHFFTECVTWTLLSGTNFCVRYIPNGTIFDPNGPSLFGLGRNVRYIAALLNSKVGLHLMRAVNPTLAFNPGDVAKLPTIVTEDATLFAAVDSMAQELIDAHIAEWNAKEEAWGFESLTLLDLRHEQITVVAAWDALQSRSASVRDRCRELEERLNYAFSELYGLTGEVTSEVGDVDPTLMKPDQAETVRRLLSYAIGCIMGRYTIDKTGLIYARGANLGFDHSQYATYRADDDGIIPILETDWGIQDDATNRIVEFLGVPWAREHLDDNLKFIADSLGPTSNEQPRDTIRRYLSTGFYKHHLSMYKRRPIYWLFSSGRQRAFQCLVYLHRYYEGTLARMRTEYVIPLQGQIAARIEQLEGDMAKATSTSHRNKLQKEQTNLKKQQTELLVYEEKLKHAADQKISLDLDDGVKVNYAKFGDLLADAKAITGGNDDE